MAVLLDSGMLVYRVALYVAVAVQNLEVVKNIRNRLSAPPFQCKYYVTHIAQHYVTHIAQHYVTHIAHHYVTHIAQFVLFFSVWSVRKLIKHLGDM
jgi:hypothetical protein